MIENLPSADIVNEAIAFVRNGETEVILGAAIGYMFGQIAEWRSLKHIEAHQRRWIEETGATNVEPNVRKMTFRRLITPLALTGAIAGYGVGEAAQTHTINIDSQPVAGLVSDLTLGTGPVGDNSARVIMPITEGIARSNKVKSTILAATGNGTKIVGLQNYETLGSDGGNTLPSTVDEAIQATSSSAGPTNPDQFGVKKGKDGAVVVVTDDDPIWTNNDVPADVAKEAQQAGNIPVYVINMSNNADTTAKGLKQISQDTGGKYYFVNKNTSPTTVVNSIRMNVLPQARPYREHNPVEPWLIVAGGATLLGSSLYRGRKRQARQDYITG